MGYCCQICAQLIPDDAWPEEFDGARYYICRCGARIKLDYREWQGHDGKPGYSKQAEHEAVATLPA